MSLGTGGTLGLGRGGLGGSIDGLLGVEGVERGIDGALVLLEDGLDDGAVHDLGALVLGNHAPRQEGHLDGIVERNPVENVIREVLDDAEEAEHDPVSEPLSIVFLSFRLDGSETGVRRIHETNNIGDRSGQVTTEYAQSQDSNNGDDEVLHIHFGLLFQRFCVGFQSGDLENLSADRIKVGSNSRHASKII